MVQLKREDFLEGGIFENTNFSKELPLPNEVLDYTFNGLKCDVDKLIQIRLLKYIWELKGVKLYNCQCKSNEHLITKEEFDNQLSSYREITADEFKEGGIFDGLQLSKTLPINQEIISYVWGNLSYYENIEEGKCFKSDEYQLQILKKCYNFQKYGVIPFICLCKKHLMFLN